MTKPTKAAKPGVAMSAMDAIYHRRSVRDYAPRTIGQPVIRALLDAAGPLGILLGTLDTVLPTSDEGVVSANCRRWEAIALVAMQAATLCPELSNL